jgi:hypothetical protein
MNPEIFKTLANIGIIFAIFALIIYALEQRRRSKKRLSELWEKKRRRVHEEENS